MRLEEALNQVKGRFGSGLKDLFTSIAAKSMWKLQSFSWAVKSILDLKREVELASFRVITAPPVCDLMV
ncbi:MAG: hypothetical protein FWG55_01590 [Candidatus Bathyarchaeota archaeon]|nr:hypothetical protein [Candidatus Termiticorpusculum sp.]